MTDGQNKRSKDKGRESTGLLAVLKGMGKRLNSTLGVVGAVTLMSLELMKLGTEKAWHFSLYGWPQRGELLNVWHRNITEIDQQDWPSIGVIVATALFAGLGAAFAASAVRYTVTTVSHHLNHTWNIFTSPPEDVVRADKETREWVNSLSAKESAELRRIIERLQNDNDALIRERKDLLLKLSQREEALRKANDRLKANERLFSQFENLSRALQSRIDRARKMTV